MGSQQKQINWSSSLVVTLCPPGLPAASGGTRLDPQPLEVKPVWGENPLLTEHVINANPRAMGGQQDHHEQRRKPKATTYITQLVTVQLIPNPWPQTALLGQGPMEPGHL